MPHKSEALKSNKDSKRGTRINFKNEVWYKTSYSSLSAVKTGDYLDKGQARLVHLI